MGKIEKIIRQELARTGLAKAEQQALGDEIAAAVSDLIRSSRLAIGGASPESGFPATQKCESVRLSARPDNGRDGGRAATNDCRMQPEAVSPTP